MGAQQPGSRFKQQYSNYIYTNTMHGGQLPTCAAVSSSLSALAASMERASMADASASRRACAAASRSPASDRSCAEEHIVR